VKDYILQGLEFLICAFVLFERASEDVRAKRWRAAGGLLLLAILFLANIFLVATGRSVLIVVPALALLFGWRLWGGKGLSAAVLLSAVVASGVWLSSPYLRIRLNNSWADLQEYRIKGTASSTGQHLEFLKKSVSIVEAAPVFGHGTGSIGAEFRKLAVGDKGAASIATVNPHNQFFAVAIQLGLVGGAVLIAMWIAHFMLFRGAGPIAWIGMVLVVQNVVASIFNSHLFDFTEGWLYVFGVGVVGGMMLRGRDLTSAIKPVAP
jgi:hypothetical protein